MIVFESRLVRRFVGRLERGEEIVATLAQLCEHERIRSAWVRAAGIFEWVELTEWNPEKEVWRTPRRVEGLVTAVGIEGTVAIRNGPPYVELHASLSKQAQAGIQSLGGTIASARVYAIDFTIEAFEDVRLERGEDPSTGLALFKGQSTRGVFARQTELREEKRAPARQMELERDDAPLAADDDAPPASAAPSAPSTGAISWAQVAAVSATAEKLPAPAPRRVERPTIAGNVPPPIPGKDRVRAAEAPDEPVPQKGDFVDHRQFGLCKIDGEDEDGGLKIRLPSGVRKVIKLDFLEVLPPRHEGDRKVFPLRPRKR